MRPTNIEQLKAARDLMSAIRIGKLAEATELGKVLAQTGRSQIIPAAISDSEWIVTAFRELVENKLIETLGRIDPTRPQAGSETAALAGLLAVHIRTYIGRPLRSLGYTFYERGKPAVVHLKNRGGNRVVPKSVELSKWYTSFKDLADLAEAGGDQFFHAYLESHAADPKLAELFDRVFAVTAKAQAGDPAKAFCAPIVTGGAEFLRAQTNVRLALLVTEIGLMEATAPPAARQKTSDADTPAQQSIRPSVPVETAQSQSPTPPAGEPSSAERVTEPPAEREAETTATLLLASTAPESSRPEVAGATAPNPGQGTPAEPTLSATTPVKSRIFPLAWGLDDVEGLGPIRGVLYRIGPGEQLLLTHIVEHNIEPPLRLAAVKSMHAFKRAVECTHSLQIPARLNKNMWILDNFVMPGAATPLLLPGEGGRFKITDPDAAILLTALAVADTGDDSKVSRLWEMARRAFVSNRTDQVAFLLMLFAAEKLERQAAIRHRPAQLRHAAHPSPSPLFSL